jgi:CheY-like chemotaxis protein
MASASGATGSAPGDALRRGWRGHCWQCAFSVHRRTREDAAGHLAEHLARTGHDTWSVLRERTSLPAPSPLDPRATSQPLRLLVVDDDTGFLEALCTSLRVAGYGVDAVADGPAALESAERLRPDVILLDIRLPGRDGHQVCQALYANPITQDIPVIFITAVREATLYRWEDETGAAACLTKPFRLDTLTAVIAAVITHAGT